MSKLPVPKFAVEIVGNLEQWTEQTDADIEDAVREAVAEQADKVLATAQTLVPVDEGTLRDSLHVRISKSGLSATVRTDAKTAPHGHLIHWGTVKLEGRPYLTQANEQHAPELKPLIESKIKAGKQS